MTIERFLLGLRRMEQQGIEMSKAATSVELTPRRAVGLMLSCAIDLTEEEGLALKQLCQIHPQVHRLNALFQQFTQMLRDRRGEDLDQWLHAAFHAGIPELRAFVNKLRQDQQAVQIGLILKWNNGVVEGHVNRLKFLKRSMYGRPILICCGYGFCIIESVHEPTKRVHPNNIHFEQDVDLPLQKINRLAMPAPAQAQPDSALLHTT